MSRGGSRLTTKRSGIRLLLPAAPALLAVAACAPPAPLTTADDLQPAGLGTPPIAGLFVGCWALTWELEGRIPSAGALLVPDSISLRDGVVFGTRERLVSPATHPTGRERRDGASGATTWESRYRMNRWWAEDDSLRVRFSDAADDEWHVRLGLDGEALGGWATHGREPMRARSLGARVRASRIGCDFG